MERAFEVDVDVDGVADKTDAGMVDRISSVGVGPNVDGVLEDVKLLMLVLLLVLVLVLLVGGGIDPLLRAQEPRSAGC